MAEEVKYTNHLSIQRPHKCDKCGSESFDHQLYVESTGEAKCNKRIAYFCDPCATKYKLKDFHTEYNDQVIRQSISSN